MSDIWKIGQEISAIDYYNKYNIESFICGELLAANSLNIICQIMTETYEVIQQDQNEYLLEIDDINNQAKELEEELRAEIEKLEAEIAELNKKKENGTITEDELAELELKTQELNGLKSQYVTATEENKQELENVVSDAENNSHKSKKEIATDYGDTAVEKGQELMNTKNKRKTFFRKIFNSWDNSHVRKAGEDLAKSGNDLLEKVNQSIEIDNKIKKEAKSDT